MKMYRALFVCFVTLMNVAARGAPPKRDSVPGGAPKLVVVLVVDQMRYEYFQTLDPVFGEGGFRRLKNEGAFFENAHHPFSPTLTAAGHATIATGTVPAHHGIIANAWYDRDAKAQVNAVADKNVQIVQSPFIKQKYENDALAKVEEEGSSPAFLRSSTFADALRMATRYKSKAISISLKARSSILSGGFSANHSYWMSEKTASFVSSTYYAPALPEWVNQFNETHSVEQFRGREWRPLPIVERVFGKEKFEAPESTVIGSAFPHILSDEKTTVTNVAQQFSYTPFATTQLLDFATAAVDKEQLGARQVTDFLAVSVSTTDIVGHSFGSESLELKDTFARLDRDLDQFFRGLDKKLGRNGYVVVLSADHGVAGLPSELMKARIPAGKISAKSLKESVEASLKETYGDASLVESVLNEQIYLNRKTIADKKLSLDDVQLKAGIAAQNFAGVRTFVTHSQFLKNQIGGDPFVQMMANGFDSQRSGDVLLVLRPHFFVDPVVAVTHGSPYRYDSHVPLVFMGPWFKKGRYFNAASTTDIAPTLSAILHITEPPSVVGHVRNEAL